MRTESFTPTEPDQTCNSYFILSVVPNSIHAAVDKGCFYFNIEVRKARLDQNYQVDLKHLESMIDGNTILIMGSYPNYPHGIIDPIL